MNLFGPVPGYETHIYDTGKEALFLLFLSFLIAFALTRLYTRLARIYGWGSASVGGVHLHHAIPGLVLALGAGLLAFTPWGNQSPRRRCWRSPSASAPRLSSTNGL
jgi:ABC-type Fe3+ transport system permease subunit